MVPAKTWAPGSFSTWHGFAGDGGLVDEGVPTGDDAVDGNARARAGSHDEQTPDTPIEGSGDPEWARLTDVERQSSTRGLDRRGDR